MKDYTLLKEKIAELEKFHRTLRDKCQDDRSTGASIKDKAWCLNENVFVGTYIQLAAANKVSFTIHTSKRPIG